MNEATRRIRDLEEELKALRELREVGKQCLSPQTEAFLYDSLRSRCDYLEVRNKQRYPEPYFPPMCLQEEDQ